MLRGLCTISNVHALRTDHDRLTPLPVNRPLPSENYIDGPVSKLIVTLKDMDLAWEEGYTGLWVTLRRGNDSIHFIENANGTRFYTWCDNPAERTVQAFEDPQDAIHAGLRRCSSV